MADEDKPQPFDPELAAMVLGAIRAKARFVAFGMAVAVGAFVYMAADAVRPLWLVAMIGVFGAVLIAFFVALVWFWLRFFAHFGAQDPSPFRGGAGPGVAEQPSPRSSGAPSVPASNTPIPDPSPQEGRERA